VLTNTVVAAGVDVVPVKFKALNQLLVVIVGIEAPLVIAKFGALVAVPPAVDPNWNVLVTGRLDTNPPPLSVSVKFVASAMDNTVIPRVECVMVMLFAPNAMALALVLLELKIPPVKSKPPRSSVPAVNVMVAVAMSDWVPPKVNVPPGILTPIPPNCLLNCGVQVCVLVNVGERPVYVPPEAKVSVLTNIVVTFGDDVVVPKFKELNQLPVVMVGLLLPVVNVKLGALAAEPPAVDPKLNVLVTPRSDMNPPVPAIVKLVASAILSTVVAAVAFVNVILLLLKLMDLVPVPVERKVPVLMEEEPLNTNEPAVKVIALVGPPVVVALRLNVPPTPLNVIGRSTALSI
jgi:hypothetical protein